MNNPYNIIELAKLRQNELMQEAIKFRKNKDYDQVESQTSLAKRRLLHSFVLVVTISVVLFWLL